MGLQERDVYQEVTDDILALLERGVRPWQGPWNRKDSKFDGSVLPVRENGELYRGINILILWGKALKCGYESHVWMTYKQAESLGGQVRKGEKGTSVVYYGQGTKSEKDKDGKSKEVKFSFLKSYSVFNIQQIDGLDLSRFEARPLGVTDSLKFFQDAGAKIIQQGSEAFYSQSKDTVCIPKVSYFKSEDHFTAVLAHEMIHWTGAELRIGRDISGKFGSEKYAREELVAEIGAAFLCAGLGVDPSLRELNASYIEKWAALLKEDKKAIFHAASMAAKGADYIKGAVSQRKSFLKGSEASISPEVLSRTKFGEKQVKDVLHLCELVHSLSVYPALKDKFAVVGGLALNAVYLPMPRVSPDIDINFIGKVTPSVLPMVRSQFEIDLYRALKAIGYENTYSPRSSWGGKYVFHSDSLKRSVEIDVSYVRGELLHPVEHREIQVFGDVLGGIKIPVKSLVEVVASKACAETMRLKPRDSLDLINIENAYPGIFDTPDFRGAYLRELRANGFDPNKEAARGVVVYERDVGKYFAPVLNDEIRSLSDKDFSREVSTKASAILEKISSLSREELSVFRDGVAPRDSLNVYTPGIGLESVSLKRVKRRI